MATTATTNRGGSPTQEDDSNILTAEPAELPLSGDELPNSDEDLDTSGAESLLVVSLGHEQARLNSPLTPAVEKSAALDRQNSWGFFDGPDEEGQEKVLRETLESTEASSSDPAKAPTPSIPPRGLDSPQRGSWLAGLRAGNRSRAGSGDAEGSAPAARSSTSSFFGDVSLKKFLPSLNFAAPPESTATKPRPAIPESGIERTDHAFRRGRSKTWFQTNSPWRTDTPSPLFGKGSLQSSNIHIRKPSAVTPPAGPSSPLAGVSHRPLRRSTSLDSFRPGFARQSTLSILEKESSWDHVTQQVNSRRKAIRDAFQDSLPQMPNLNLSYLRPDVALKNMWDSQIESSRQLSGISDVKDHYKAALQDAETRLPPRNPRSKCPSLDEAVEHLTGDVVILGGYRGSILRELELPQRQLWVPVKVGLNIRRVNLEVGLAVEDEEDMHNHIFASGMLANIGPVDMGRRLFKKLRGCDNARKGVLRVWDYGYDWRLSPHLLSRRMIDFLEGLQCNKSKTDPASRGATVIAHSMGGLITRHAANQRPDLFAGVIYAGTPQHAVNILGPLRNGDDVLLSSKVLTAQVNFSFRTSFLLLPENGHCFVDKNSKKEYLVDFFDADSWKRYAFSPCVATVAPPWSPAERKSLLGSLYDSLPSLLSNTAMPLKAEAPEGSTAKKLENIARPDEGTVGIQVQPAVPAARTSTLSPDAAMNYLRRTLAEIKEFKQELQHKPELEAGNRYPPHALIYSTSVPTVYGARVASREAIKHADAFDDLAFASGDGVVLARAAMMPRGYRTVTDGRVRTERGHVSLLADLEAVGKCLVGLQQGRAAGIGMGKLSEATGDAP